MLTQRLSEPEFHTRKSRGQSIPRCCQISPNVNACGEKVRQHHDTFSSRRDTACSPFVNVRLGKLQERRDYGNVFAASS
jgi:hypothetical protein